MDVKSWNSGAFRVKGTDHSVLSFTHYSLLPTPLLCTNTNSMVNHNTHSHFLLLGARWLALRHCTTFTLNDCKQTDSIPDRPAHSSVAIPTELSGPQLICVCTNIEQYDATLAASLYKLRTCLQHNLRPCLLRAGPQKHGYCLIGLSRSQDSQLITVARLQNRRTENRVSITGVDRQLCTFSVQHPKQWIPHALSWSRKRSWSSKKTTHIPLVPNVRNGRAIPT